jgi:hypothetical protein
MPAIMIMIAANSAQPTAAALGCRWFIGSP